MTNVPGRRRFLQLAGTGTVASVAGCADSFPALQNDDEDGESGDDEELDFDPDGMYTAVVQPDQADVQELQTAMMAGELDQEDAQEQYEELMNETQEAFRAHVDDDGDLSVEARHTEYGLYLVDGSAEAVLGTIGTDPVDHLRGGTEYERIIEQQAAAAEAQQGQEGETEDSDQEGE